MAEADYRRWASLLRERIGMCPPLLRRSFLASVIDQRVRELGLSGFADYYHYVVAAGSESLEWGTLLGRLTVQETRFFRDAQALQVVSAVCLPLMRDRVAAGESVHIWSVGCATGEEPFTLAMLIDGYLQEARLQPYFGVLGSDINPQALSHARQGWYDEHRLTRIPSDYHAKYCRRRPNSGFQVEEHLRRRVCFIRSNILETAKLQLPAMDLIYCQNVLLYFDRNRREEIAAALASRLRPYATLVLGVGELIGWRGEGLQRIGGTDVLVYQRQSGW